MTFGAFRRASLTAGLVLLGALVAGCDDDDDDDDVFFFPPQNQGRMQVYLTDAPPDLDGLRSFIVNIQRIDAIGAVQTGTTGNTVTIFTSNLTNGTAVDLLPLSGGDRQLIANTNVPPGTYDRLRFVFSGARVDFQPSGNAQQRTYSTENDLLSFAGGNPPQEFEVDLPGDGIVVTSGQTEQVVVDMDVAESLNAVGDTANPEEIVVTPTGRARDLDDGGAIVGVVRAGQNTSSPFDDAPIQNAQVVLLDQNQQIVARTKTDAQGVFAIQGLPAGTYTLQATTTEVTTPTQTTVQVGDQQITQDLTIPTATTTSN